MPELTTHQLPDITGEWTLFLDRDGVINKKLDNDYVKHLGEFDLLPGAIEAIVGFSKIFNRVIIVTNQQGIGKGLMTSEDLDVIHQHLIDLVTAQGGQIDAIYHAPKLASENSEYRKPGIGMAKKAQRDFEEINFSQSMMVGDSLSDMEFGENAGMFCVFIDAKKVHDYSGHSTTSLSRLYNLIKAAV